MSLKSLAVDHISASTFSLRLI